MKHDWLVRLDSYANETYGRAISSAVVEATCVSCGGPAHKFTRSDTGALYVRVGLCERCQDAQHSISDKIIPFNQSYRTS